MGALTRRNFIKGALIAGALALMPFLPKLVVPQRGVTFGGWFWLDGSGVSHFEVMEPCAKASNQWHHVVGVFPTSTERVVFLDVTN